VLALSPLDAALGVRGLDVHWAFMYARDLDAALLQRALAATLADYPVLAGRVRVKSKTGKELHSSTSQLKLSRSCH